MKVTEPAPAKINLALHLRRKRADGYHDLETLFAFACDGDVVTIEVADQNSFAITGPFASALKLEAVTAASPAKAGAQSRRTSNDVPPGEAARNWAPAFAGEGKNLVTKAALAFRTTYAIPQSYAITLEKNLPLASGIGGGSADAAATLRALAKLHGIDPADRRLFVIARGLGADVPACLLGQTAFATGKGDDLTPLPLLGGLPLLLVNPGVPLSTAAMFARWDGIDRGGIASEGSALDRARAGRNDFTAPAMHHAPVVADVLDLLAQAPGCTFARLSGSGATCFGFFADAMTRDAAARQAAANGWWTLATCAA